MLDTTVLNAMASGAIQPAALSGLALFVTYVQHDELKQTPDGAMRAALLAMLQKVRPEALPTETAVWDDSYWGAAKWGRQDGVFEGLLARIRELDRKHGKKVRPFNQSRDARIAETAIRQNLILVTGDLRLAQAAKEFGCEVIDQTEFFGSIRARQQ